jgi:hypothetical protein
MVTASLREVTSGQDQIAITLRPVPESKERARHDVGLTIAARRLAESALEELGRLGVVAALDDEGRARFRATRALPPAARRVVETFGDVVEVYLRERNSGEAR